MNKNRLSLLGMPALLWLMFFVTIPLIIVLLIGFLNRGTYGGIEWTFSLNNYARVFEPVYLKILLSSLKLSAATAAICLVLAYPIAWALATCASATRNALVVVLAIPFLTNLITRVYAIKLFTGMDGPLQIFLNWLGVGFDPYQTSQNSILVLYGMVTTYLPFMIFPLYAMLEKFDFTLVEAAQDLGATRWQAFFKVILPNTKLAAISGMTLVFVPAMGEFVIPDLLGGAKTMLAGNLITEQFLKARDWPFGAALSIVLMVVLLGLPALFRRIAVRDTSGVSA